jgi:hypothetical protein
LLSVRGQLSILLTADSSHPKQQQKRICRSACASEMQWNQSVLIAWQKSLVGHGNQYSPPRPSVQQLVNLQSIS